MGGTPLTKSRSIRTAETIEVLIARAGQCIAQKIEKVNADYAGIHNLITELLIPQVHFGSALPLILNLQNNNERVER